MASSPARGSPIRSARSLSDIDVAVKSDEFAAPAPFRTTLAPPSVNIKKRKQKVVGVQLHPAGRVLADVRSQSPSTRHSFPNTVIKPTSRRSSLDKEAQLYGNASPIQIDKLHEVKEFDSSLVSIPSTKTARSDDRSSGRQVSMKKYNTAVAELLKAPKSSPQIDEESIYTKPEVENLEKAMSRSTGYNGLYFDDQNRRIDFVLVYEQKTDHKSDYDNEKKKSISRKKFLMGLLRAGVEMERAFQIVQGSIINYIKLHLPFAMLCAYAEDLNFTVPLKARETKDISSQDCIANVYKCLHMLNPHKQEVPNQPKKFYTCKFKTDKLAKFYGGSMETRDEMFFSPTQRSAAVLQILRTTSFGKRSRGEVGIEALIDTNIFNAAYPLHDGFKEPLQPVANDSLLSKRQMLWKYWASYGKWYKNQPFDHVREYFGEKIGMYFVWLGFYTKLLLPAAIVGVGVFIYGIFNVSDNQVVKEICQSGETLRMCPPCDECPAYYLSELCIFVTVGYLFDHPGTVFYAVFMSFWAVIFLEFWQRQAAKTAFDWDCFDYTDSDERPRPEYVNMAPKRARNPITNMLEPYFPKKERTRRIVASFTFLLIMIGIVFMFILACILYKVLVSIHLARIPWQVKELKQFSGIITVLTGTILNLILIIIMGCIYELFALKLTHWEMHRTQSEFENSYTLKVFLFQFVNYFSSIFYVAFFKGKFIGYPGSYYRFLGLRNEECTSGGCMIELAQQLLIIMVGIQIVNNITEVVFPKLMTWWQTRSIKTDDRPLLQRWEADYQLLPYPGLFSEYLELALQFGFITIFVAACPLAPLFALINNWVELRLDARKFVSDYRRPVVERAQGIGVWSTILTSIAHIAVISNAFVIAFTSDFLPQSFYQNTVDEDMKGFVNFTLSSSHHLPEPCLYKDYRDKEGRLTKTYWQLLAVRLAFVVAFEHFVFVVMRGIDFIVPDIPEQLVTTIKREQYLGKQALLDNQTAELIRKHTEEDEDDEVRARSKSPKD